MRRKLLYAAGRIEARYVKNCGMLREELRHAVRKIAVCYVKNFCTLCGRIAVRNVKNCSTLCGDCGMLCGRLRYAAWKIAVRCGGDCSTLNKKRCPSDLVQACLPRGHLGTLLRKPKRVRANTPGGFLSLTCAYRRHQASYFIPHRITRTRGGIGVRLPRADYLSRRRTAIYTLLYIRARGEASYSRTLRTSEPPCMRKTATTTPCAWGKGRVVLPD